VDTSLPSSAEIETVSSYVTAPPYRFFSFTDTNKNEIPQIP